MTTPEHYSHKVRRVPIRVVTRTSPAPVRSRKRVVADALEEARRIWLEGIANYLRRNGYTCHYNGPTSQPATRRR